MVPYARVHLAAEWAARSARSQVSCGDPAPQPPTSEQFELSAIVPAPDLEAVVLAGSPAARRSAKYPAAEAVSYSWLPGTRPRIAFARPHEGSYDAELRERSVAVLDVAEHEDRVVPARQEEVGRR